MHNFINFLIVFFYFFIVKNAAVVEVFYNVWVVIVFMIF